jgi:nucleoside-diphosphate-sugar epimerase
MNPWLAASSDPECPWHGPEHGLFAPSTPHPRYIVTGGAGFIGSHLVKRLAAEVGPGQVKVVDNFWRGHIARFQREDGSWAINPQQDVCAMDLRVLSDALKYLRGADYVYHLADIVAGVNYVFGNQLSVYHSNVIINTNTLRAAKSYNVTNYVYVGTACSFPQHLEMGRGIHALREDQAYPADPESSYGWSKLMGEYEAELARSSGFNVGVLRFHNVYGPGSDSSAATGQVIPALLRKAMAYPQAPFIVWGSGSQYRDFVFVEDVVSALMLVKDKGMNKGVIEIGSGHATTVKKLAHTIAGVVGRAMDKKIDVQFDTSMPEGDCGRIAVLKRAESTLGWRPHRTLQQGLEATLDWMSKEQNRSRVLVVLIGQPRGGELAWKSLHRHLLLPNNAHLATLLTPVSTNTSRTMLEAMAQWVWTVPEPADGDWGVWMDKAAALCPPDDGRNWPELCGGAHIWAGGFEKCPRHKSMSGVQLAYRWLLSQKIMLFNLHQQYDYIILSRSDYLYLCDHPTVAVGNTSAVWVPQGEGYGGYTDRHLEAAAPKFLQAINITQEMVCNPRQHRAMLRIDNIESLLAYFWRLTGIAVCLFPFGMFTVRAAGDPTSWSLGFEHTDLAPFGLKAKYPGEMGEAIASCRVSDVSQVLRSVEQHNVALFYASLLK